MFLVECHLVNTSPPSFPDEKCQQRRFGEHPLGAPTLSLEYKGKTASSREFGTSPRHPREGNIYTIAPNPVSVKGR